MTDKTKHSARIKEQALDLGFSACGIARARMLSEEEERLRFYLDSNYQGEMQYLANHFEKRLDPTLLVPGAKSVVVVLLNYFPQQLQTVTNAPIISKYAYGNDYHTVVKDKLKALFDFIDTELQPIQGRIFTDSAPVLERAWAVQAGLGWIGKNGLLLNRELGSFFFIGELIVDLELEYDQPFQGEYCGNCNQCLSACPTKALLKPYILDARRCISYLTIESKSTIPEEFSNKLMKRAFGCDICQDVCPWNRKTKPTSIEQLNPHPNLLQWSKEDWLNLTPNQFHLLFRNSAIKRAGYSKLMENIRLATSSEQV